MPLLYYGDNFFTCSIDLPDTWLGEQHTDLSLHWYIIQFNGQEKKQRSSLIAYTKNTELRKSIQIDWLETVYEKDATSRLCKLENLSHIKRVFGDAAKMGMGCND